MLKCQGYIALLLGLMFMIRTGHIYTTDGLLTQWTFNCQVGPRLVMSSYADVIGN